VTELREHSDVVTKLLAELERSNTDLAQFDDVASHDSCNRSPRSADVTT